MKEMELFVKLLVPDNTCLTAFHTLEKLGYKELQSMEREDYYNFSVDQTIDEFTKDIANVDILINSNKHSHIVKEVGSKFKDKLCFPKF